MSRNSESLLDALLNERAGLQTMADRLAEELDRSKAREAALQALLNERDEKLSRYAEFLAWCESAPVGSGVCCCGGNMEGHGHYADHGAVDEWDHSLGNWAKELRE